MKNIKKIGIEYLLPAITGVVTFIIFFVFNKYHLSFREQFQLFQDTTEYFLRFVGLPGGISGYAGEFLTQFFLFPITGAFIIAILLTLTHYITIKLLKSIRNNSALLPLTFIPALFYATLLFDNFYPIAGLIGFIISLSALLLYIRTTKISARLICGLIAVPLLYFTAGGSYLIFIVSAVIFEVMNLLREKNNKGSILLIVTIVTITALGIILPTIIRRSYLHVPAIEAIFSDFYYDLKANVPITIWLLFSTIPLLILIFSFTPSSKKNNIQHLIISSVVTLLFIVWGLKINFNPRAEEIMFFDYQSRRGEWEKIIEHSEKKPPKNNLSLSILNLALSKTGKMGTDLFKYRQNGSDGLFLNIRDETVEPMMGNEIYFHLGLTSASQYFVFASNETTASMQKSVRSMQRLVETNIINENYEVASKYLSLLENTLFYKKWAKSARKFTENKELVLQHPVWSERKAMAICNDFFFNVPEIEKALIYILEEHPTNKTAFEYLMSYYLLNKNLKGFMENIYRIEKINYSRMPVLYEEAALFAVSLSSSEPGVVENYPVSQETKKRMRAYADIYTSSSNHEEALKEKYSSSFWYYFHFK